MLIVESRCSMMCPVGCSRGYAMATTTTKAFATRLRQACDDSQSIPEYGKGRQVVISKRLKVSQEAVRKWFEGESMPRPPKMKALASFLDVDESWLALGITPEMDRNERRRLARFSSGAVCMTAGLIMMEGGNVAGPSDTDPRRGYVDFYAIMRGTQLALHVCSARETSNGHFEFIVPREYNDVRCIGFVPTGVGKFQLIDMPTKLIDEHKQHKAGDYVIAVSQVGTSYHSGSDEWPKFRAFGEIL